MNNSYSIVPHSTDGSPDRDLGGAIDVLFGVLSERDRRIVLAVLREREAVPSAGLAAMIASRRDRSRDRIETLLVHEHLPMMETADLLSFDRESGSVVRTKWPSDIRKIVRLVVQAEFDDAEG